MRMMMLQISRQRFTSLPARSALGFGLLLSLACKSTPAEPESQSVLKSAPAETATTASAGEAAPAAAAPQKPSAPQPPVSEDDPVKGKFTLDDATAGLGGTGPLVAEVETELGKLSCDLYDDKAPVTVANFVGLARGLRPFKAPDGKWTKKPAYDGTTFHRVVKGFMIQGGDPFGTGSGEPGYVIPDEIWEGAKHDRRGLLCMANRGPNTNGQQFFITDGSAPHLDRGYTIFGKCGPDNVVEKLASVEVQGDRSLKPTKIKKITVKRKAAK